MMSRAPGECRSIWSKNGGLQQENEEPEVRGSNSFGIEVIEHGEGYGRRIRKISEFFAGEGRTKTHIPGLQTRYLNGYRG